MRLTHWNLVLEYCLGFEFWILGFVGMAGVKEKVCARGTPHSFGMRSTAQPRERASPGLDPCDLSSPSIESLEFWALILFRI